MGKEVWMWLAAGLGYGAVNSGDLLSAYPGGPEEIATNLGDARLDEILTQKQAERLASSRPEDFSLRIAHYETQGIYTLPFTDPAYPDMLRNILNPPLVLFAKGDVSLLNGQLSIGMVGARRPSAYGVEAVRAIGKGIALGGAIIVSGLAAGLDAEAHKAALAVNGPTIACIAFGHDYCYPSSNKKLKEVIEHTGLIISEYPLGTGAEKQYFLHRNRLIAGLSHGLVVAEARALSGTMSTVNFAIDYGRDVFAVPGSIFSELSGGTNAIIRDGGYLAGSATDILTVYGIQLDAEDPVLAAAKQAAEGRPVAASASPAPWQQNLSRQTAHAAQQKAAALPPAEQTLGEALQNMLNAPAGRATGAQALAAFHRLQQDMPPPPNTQDAQTLSLDERVMAVSDHIEFTGASKTSAAPHKPYLQPDPEPGKVRPFRWDALEHLSASEPKKDSPPGAAKPETPPRLTPRRNSASIGRIEPVSRVQPVEAVVPVSPLASVAAANSAAPPEQTTPAAASPPMPHQDSEPVPYRTKQSASLASLLQTSTAAPRAENKGSKVQAETKPYQRPPGVSSAPLAGKLRTVQTHPAPEGEEDNAPGPLDALSANARRAHSQLGVKPISLGRLCEASGLSPGEAMAALTELELAGLSRQLAGRQFAIMQ